MLRTSPYWNNSYRKVYVMEPQTSLCSDPVKQLRQRFQFQLRNSRSGVLQAQKLKTHLLRTYSSKVLPLKPGVGQTIVMHASPTVKDFFLKLISALLVHSPAFLQTFSEFFLVLAVANTDSCLGPQNKIGHPTCRFKSPMQAPVLNSRGI